MKRKNFLATALLALPVVSFANQPVFKRKQPNGRIAAKKAFVVKASESRYNGKPATPKNAFLHCKISSTDTGDHLFIQTSTPIAPKKVEDFFNHISIHGAVPNDIIPDGW